MNDPDTKDHTRSWSLWLTRGWSLWLTGLVLTLGWGSGYLIGSHGKAQLREQVAACIALDDANGDALDALLDALDTEDKPVPLNDLAGLRERTRLLDDATAAMNDASDRIEALTPICRDDA